MRSTEIDAQRHARHMASEKDGIRVRIVKGAKANRVRMPSGQEIVAGGVLRDNAVKNGGVILDLPMGIDSKYNEGDVIVLSTYRAHELIQRGEAEAVDVAPARQGHPNQ